MLLHSTGSNITEQHATLALRSRVKKLLLDQYPVHIYIALVFPRKGLLLGTFLRTSTLRYRFKNPYIKSRWEAREALPTVNQVRRPFSSKAVHGNRRSVTV